MAQVSDVLGFLSYWKSVGQGKIKLPETTVEICSACGEERVTDFMACEGWTCPCGMIHWMGAAHRHFEKHEDGIVSINGVKHRKRG